MQLKLTLDLDNAAFQDNPSEVADILRSLADKLDHQTADELVKKVETLRDSNGNKVGYVEVMP